MKNKPNYMTDSDWNAEMELAKELARDDYYDKAIFAENGEWYFWDETWTQKHGPFQSEDEAVETLKKYSNYLNQ